MKIEPEGSPDEVAAILAALEALRADKETPEPRPSRWELSGRLGRMLPPERKLEGSPWSYAGREGKA